MKLPAAEPVARLLTDLLARQVIVKPTPRPGATDPGYVGQLVLPTGALGALSFSDRPFAAFVGAALALMPRSVAEEAVRKGVLPTGLLENYFEVVNIATALFNGVNDRASHVRLTEIQPTGPTLAAPLRALWLKPTARVDLLVDVAGYGSGKLTFVC